MPDSNPRRQWSLRGVADAALWVGVAGSFGLCRHLPARSHYKGKVLDFSATASMKCASVTKRSIRVYS
jgi:hypothetical protein